jgi:hypothetical protein
VELVPFLQVSAAGLLAGVVWYLLRQISTGQWVPRRELDYMRADRDARLAEKDEQINREHAAQAEWRAAHETSEQRGNSSPTTSETSPPPSETTTTSTTPSGPPSSGGNSPTLTPRPGLTRSTWHAAPG